MGLRCELTAAPIPGTGKLRLRAARGLDSPAPADDPSVGRGPRNPPGKPPSRVSLPPKGGTPPRWHRHFREAGPGASRIPCAAGARTLPGSAFLAGGRPGPEASLPLSAGAAGASSQLRETGRKSRGPGVQPPPPPFPRSAGKLRQRLGSAGGGARGRSNSGPSRGSSATRGQERVRLVPSGRWGRCGAPRRVPRPPPGPCPRGRSPCV